MIWAVILAAGQSRRMGRQKLLLPLPDDGAPMIRRVAQTALASTVDRVIAVVDPAQPAVSGALTGLSVEIVANPDAASGMGSSLRTAARCLLATRSLEGATGTAAGETDVEAALDEAAPTVASAAVFLLGDQPTVATAAIDALVAAHTVRRALLAQASYEDGRGHPVLFARAFFSELADVKGDQGGREVLAKHRDQLVAAPVRGPAPRDIDTQEEYRRLFGATGADRGPRLHGQ